ncbi:transcriptional regulator, TetR family [Lentzea fradiae]|uniref:Transcriptional regulator, TetR family n=1 Tax=Lentzea fradiae TaxID=200378 RepID=A0A1G7UMP8_9PSEU|nr:TetR/AcrR family transcriptional regulator [Lentzea fradiae]SDG48521.1 transcriptional regulator, TetR family [Lentzea fradiae]
MTRPYHSPRRAQDAADTRRDILRAAAELFSTKGYGRVTVAEIAKKAGVAPQTVYSSAGNKSQILREILGESIVRSDAASALDAIRRTDSVAEAMALLAKGTRMGNESEQRVVDVLLAAIPVHEDSAELWEQATGSYREALRETALHLRDKGLLTTDVDRATDVLWFCFGFAAWRTLVKECGWSWDDAERWLARQAVAMLSP